MLTPVRTLPRPIKRSIMVAADTFSVTVALWLAFALKYDSLTHGLERNPWLYVGTTVASLLLFWFFGLYRSIVRYIGPRAMVAVLGGVVGSSGMLWVLGQTIAWRPITPSLITIYATIALVWV